MESASEGGVHGELESDRANGLKYNHKHREDGSIEESHLCSAWSQAAVVVEVIETMKSSVRAKSGRHREDQESQTRQSAAPISAMN